ncbi:MAG: hydrogenase maturation protease [Chloroflexi bacterium]|nr:hydrogenase maturation protease [Chloroflexota bacterium]
MADHAGTLVLGVGSLLMGDDAVGVLAVQRLQALPDLPPGVTVLDGGTAGLGLIPLWDGYQRVVLVDAVMMDLPPGTIRRFSWHEARLISHDRTLSLHQTDLSHALALAETLGMLPPEVLIFGVQPEHVEWDRPLSPAVERALPDLIDALLDELRSELTHGA